MPVASQELTTAPIRFGNESDFFIVTHKSIDENLLFTYRISLIYDSNVSIDPNLNLQVRVVESQKRLPEAQLTRRSILNGSAIKLVQDKLLQSFETKLSPLVVFNVPRVDLNRRNLVYDIDIPASLARSQFVFQIVQVDSSNNVTTSESITINHNEKLKNYDIPGNGFSLRSGYIDDNTLVLEASSFDNNIGAFNFFVKNETPTDVRPVFFESIGDSALDDNNTAQITYNIERGQKLKFSITPTSKFTNRKMSHSTETEVGSSYTNLYFPFYVTNINDVGVTFIVKDVPSSIKKVMLYRQILNQAERKFISDGRVTTGDLVIKDVERLTQYDCVYSLDYIDENSTLKTSSSFLFLPSLKLNTLASVAARKVEQTVKEGTVITKFRIDVNYNNTSPFDQIVSDLKKVGLDNLFDEDLKKMTNNLKPLIRVLVSRINLESGEEADLGVIEPGEVEYANSTQASYLYRFEAAIRSAPELMENIASSQNVLANISRDSKDIVDTASKAISNRFKASQNSFTAKFLSRSSLRGSTLKYGNAASGIDLGFHAGRTGIFADISIPKEQASISIKDLRVQVTPSSKMLSWSYTGSPYYFNVSVNGVTKTALTLPGQRQCYFYLDSRIKGKIEVTAVPAGENQGAYAALEIR